MSKELIEHHRSPDKIEVIADEIPARISWNGISEQVMSVLNIERGIFYTLIELLFRPGKAVRIHLFKDRKRMVNPIRFLVLSTTLATLVTFHYMDSEAFYESFELGFTAQNGEGSKNALKHEIMSAIATKFFGLMQQFVNLSYFFLVPTGALVAWIMLRKKYNVPELAIANCYMWSMMNCITILIFPLSAVESLSYMTAVLIGIFTFIYPFYFYYRFIDEGWKGVAKTMIINTASFILILLFFVGLTVYHFWDIEAIARPHAKSF